MFPLVYRTYILLCNVRQEQLTVIMFCISGYQPTAVSRSGHVRQEYM